MNIIIGDVVMPTIQIKQ